MTSESVSAAEYTPKVGDRYPMVRPRDSGALTAAANDTIDSRTTVELDYNEKSRGDRYDVERPREAGAWRVSVDMIMIKQSMISTHKDRRQNGRSFSNTRRLS